MIALAAFLTLFVAGLVAMMAAHDPLSRLSEQDRGRALATLLFALALGALLVAPRVG